MSESLRKRCSVAYATSGQQYVWPVDLPLQATIAEAIEVARQTANMPDLPWDSAPVGIFGDLRQRSDRPAPGDRIEMYRPLRADPRQRRREQVQKIRKATRE